MTILERAIRLFHQNGISDTQVVVGHRSEDLFPLLQSCGARWVVNESYREGMFSSVIAGISRLEVDREAFFLLPVDIPLVRPRTIRDLLKAYPKTGKHILYPTFQGRRGHPPLIAAAFAEEIRLWKGEGGLRSFLDNMKLNPWKWKWPTNIFFAMLTPQRTTRNWSYDTRIMRFPVSWNAECF